MLNEYDLEDMRPEPLPERDPSQPNTERGAAEAEAQRASGTNPNQ